MSSDDAPHLTVRPANDVTWEDLCAVFGSRGPGYRCQCQRYKLGRGESFGAQPVGERAARLREQTNAGTAAAEPDTVAATHDPGGPSSADGPATSGLVAFDGQTPVGWCAVEPRQHYSGLVRVYSVPWEGRDTDPADPTVWAVTCLFVRPGHRKRGVGRDLAAAAVEHARRHGARALEAYPIDPGGATISEELHVGTVGVYAAAGLTEVHRPTKRRRVMRIEFTTGEGDRP